IACRAFPAPSPKARSMPFRTSSAPDGRRSRWPRLCWRMPVLPSSGARISAFSVKAMCGSPMPTRPRTSSRRSIAWANSSRAAKQPDKTRAARLDVKAAGAKNIVVGIACGFGAALFWAGGFTAARHGITAGVSPFRIAFHRYVWAGLVFLPSVLLRGAGDLNGIGWRRGLTLAILGGPGQAVVSAAGFLMVPLAHGGVIQPSCAALARLLLAALVLGEKLPRI